MLSLHSVAATAHTAQCGRRPAWNRSSRLYGCRSSIRPAALPGWAQQLLGAKPQARTDPGRPLATELLKLVASTQSSSSPADARNKVDALLDELIGCGSLKFDEQLLQGGPWRVLYTRGSVQLWKATYSAGKLVKSSNAASQDLDPVTRSVINKAEYLGDKLWVTASGTYTPLDDSPSLPKPIQANISSGCIHVFGVDIPLPIRGTGLFEVVYLDERLRVFRSGGALAVQVKEEYLREQGLL